MKTVVRSSRNRLELTVDGGLTGQLLKHLGGTSKSVTRLANANVEDELLDAELPHGVLGLLFGRLHISR